MTTPKLVNEKILVITGGDKEAVEKAKDFIEWAWAAGFWGDIAFKIKFQAGKPFQILVRPEESLML